MTDERLQLQSLRLQGYTVFQNQNLTDFGDLNVIIGPNNSGKTNILRAINKLPKIDRKRAPLQDTERYYENNDRDVTLDFEFDDGELVLESDRYGSMTVEEGDEEFDESCVLLCETERLTEYRSQSLDEYLTKTLQGADIELFLDSLRQIVDPTIDDLRGGITGGSNFQLSSRGQNGNTLEHELSRYGSGVKSLAMLLADIHAKDPDILLIDEPEMGLYPAAKRRFLKMLLELSGDHQIFLTTQDASFVNPLFWRESDQDVSVYHYSISREMQGREAFLNLDVNEPSTFAGFLPQTTSIKDYHIYVEGKDDVKVVRNFLHRFLEQVASGETRGELLDRTEIYHLNGNNWEHFLSTIPAEPYSSILLLDSDMNGQAENVIQRYEESEYQSLPQFVKCDDTVDIREKQRGSTVPIYLLNRADISEYIGVDEKVEIARTAWDQTYVPEEFVDILFSLFESHLPSHSSVKSSLNSNVGYEGESSNENMGIPDGLNSLAKKINIPPAALNDFIDIDPIQEEPPFLLIDANDLGDTKVRRQLVCSLLILSVWDECYEGDQMKSSLLKDALEYSGVNSENMYRMYDAEEAEVYFDRKGGGSSATIKLRRPGKREAYKQFRNLL